MCMVGRVSRLRVFRMGPPPDQRAERGTGEEHGLRSGRGADVTAERRRNDRRDPHGRRDIREGLGGAFRVVNVAHDSATRHGSDAGPGGLQKTHHDQDLEAVDERADDARQNEQRETGQKHRPPAEPVAKDAGNGLGGPETEQVGRDEELNLRRTDVELHRQRRQGRRDHDHRERRQCAGGAQQDQQRGACTRSGRAIGRRHRNRAAAPVVVSGRAARPAPRSPRTGRRPGRCPRSRRSAPRDPC